MPLQLGTWRFNSNGMEGSLSFASVDALGHVYGSFTLVDVNFFSGLWNEVTQELSFSPLSPVGAGSVLPIVFRGYLFSTPATPQPGQDISWNLAGYFQMLDTDYRHIVNMPKPDSRRNTFGWSAQFTAIV